MTHQTPTSPAPQPHDLVRVVADELVGVDLGPRPAWLPGVLAVTPVWAVVRRASAPAGCVPVGLRGRTRGRRWAAIIPAAGVLESVSPAQVPRSPAPDRAVLAPFTTLAAITPLLNSHHPGRWGVGGSLAFELVTGRPTIREDSDIDLLIDAPVRLSRGLAGLTRAVLTASCLPNRVDIQVSTPLGSFALDEWLRQSGHRSIALKTITGPRLVLDPWSTS